MIDKETLSLMAGITSADEWTRIQTTDPGIAAADDKWDKALSDAKPYLPGAIYEELSNASASVASAHPEEMSRYYLARMEAAV